MTGKYLITTDSWFTAPNGKQYKAAWGNVEIVDDSILGLKTNRMSTNWFAKVGSEDKHIIIAGCQIHYAIKRNDKPNLEPSEDWQADANKLNIFERPSHIYVAE
ncbi:MAG: hypothetical protein GY834_07900 [Bacteroidetes bacterium]|nr:hypothetical protein [Bacteroidota bacterium]